MRFERARAAARAEMNRKLQPPAPRWEPVKPPGAEVGAEGPANPAPKAKEKAKGRGRGRTRDGAPLQQDGAEE